MSLHQPGPESTVAHCQAYLRDRMRKRETVPCPVCSRTVRVARRRINRAQAETLLAIYRETLVRRPSRHYRPWIHVEHELVAEGKAPSVGRDWSQLRHWKVIESKVRSGSADPKAKGSGYWRLTDFGLEVMENPKRLLLPDWIDTWNGRAWSYGPLRVSFVSCLGRAFNFDEEIRRAS